MKSYLAINELNKKENISDKLTVFATYCDMYLDQDITNLDMNLLQAINHVSEKYKISPSVIYSNLLTFVDRKDIKKTISFIKENETGTTSKYIDIVSKFGNDFNLDIQTQEMIIYFLKKNYPEIADYENLYFDLYDAYISEDDFLFGLACILEEKHKKVRKL